MKWLEERSVELLRLDDPKWPDRSTLPVSYEHLNAVLLKDDNPKVIVPVTTFELNERMAAQQGQFLCSLTPDINFTALLVGMLMRPYPVQRPVVSRILIDRTQRLALLKELRRMNIHSASLFPGLDGFSRSLAENLDVDIDSQIEAEKRLNLQAIKVFERRRRGGTTT